MALRVTRYLSVITALVVSFPGSGTALAAAPDWPWVAYGDLRGNVEPCGCDLASDLGGLRRIGSLLRTERVNNPKLWAFDLGNDLPRGGAEDELVNDLIAKSRLVLQPTAVLFNITELAASNQTSAAPAAAGVAVLSNSRPDAPRPEGVRPYLSGSNVIVFGYAYRSDLESKGIEGVSKALLKRWEEVLRKNGKGLTKVLLFSGSDADLKSITRRKLFDLVISSNTTPIAQVPTQIEKTEPGRLLRLANDGLEVYMVPVGGQGVLRGGRLRDRSGGKSVADPLRSGGDSSDTSPPDGSSPSARAVPATQSDLVTWLGLEWDAGAPLKREFDEYNKLLALRFHDRSKDRLAALSRSPYVGSEGCQSCHTAAFAAWKKSAHAHAFDTLKGKGKSRDPTCVSCHVIGFKDVGGFVSEKDSPQLANVGCENCHGPRRAHAGNPSAPKDPKADAASARAMCVSCHVPPHSTKFAFDIYWKRIIHRK
jgi:nitrate/TMAO reductase-like tetraheme cytochrome c subunit